MLLLSLNSFFAVPTATILGGPDLYVDKGSTINLTCIIKFSPEPPTHIFWYHQDKVSAINLRERKKQNEFKSLLSTSNYLAIIEFHHLQPRLLSHAQSQLRLERHSK